MPKRRLKTLTSPEAFGLFVSLLARYSTDAPDKAEIEKRFERKVGDDASTRSVATKLINNFHRIPIARRIRDLHDLAQPKLDSFPENRFETAFKAMPLAVVNEVPFDDVGRAVLPPLTPDERIIIQFSGIYCSKETGDQLGFVGASDEIYVTTNVLEIVTPTQFTTLNSTTTVHHPFELDSYKNVDTADSRNGPIAACWEGKPNLVSVICTVHEHDFGDPDRFKDEIHLIVSSAFAVAVILFPSLKLAGILAAIELLVVEAINWLIDTDDDLIETVTAVIELDRLRIMARNPLKPFVGEHQIAVPTGVGFELKTVKETTDILHHFATKHSGAGGNYDVCFRVKLNKVEAAPV